MEAVLSTEIKRAVADALAESAIAFKPLMTVRSFARLIDVGPTFVYGEIKAGRLKAKRVGDKMAITGADAVAYVANLPEAA